MASSLLTPLRIALLESGRSQKWLADSIGMHESSVSRIVNGLRPSDETARLIASALGRPMAALWPSMAHDGDLPTLASAPTVERRKAA